MGPTNLSELPRIKGFIYKGSLSKLLIFLSILHAITQPFSSFLPPACQVVGPESASCQARPASPILSMAHLTLFSSETCADLNFLDLSSSPALLAPRGPDGPDPLSTGTLSPKEVGEGLQPYKVGRVSRAWKEKGGTK